MFNIDCKPEKLSYKKKSAKCWESVESDKCV